MSELYGSVDCNNLKFEHVGPTKDVSFDEYKDSKKTFWRNKNYKIKDDEAKNKENEFLNKLNNTKICKKNYRTKRSDQ